jgi:endonuclease/exonuclease/phosphatase family metal-dependent hydrolase
MTFIIFIFILFIINVIIMRFFYIKHYRIKDNLENTEEEEENKKFKILSYNIKMFPNFIFSDEQTKRATLIPKNINDLNEDIDCVIFNEILNEKAEKILDKNMEKYGFTYRSQKLGSAWKHLLKLKLEDGGVKIYSKYPIIKEKETLYKNGGKGEQISGKGCIYVKIDKLGTNFNVIGTHLQSGRTEDLIKIRETQIKEIRTFIDKLDINKNELLVIGGDFNIDLYSQKELFNNVLKTLNAEKLERHPESIDNTSKTDFHDRELGKEDKKGKWIDHIFYIKDNLIPKKSNIKSIILRDPNGYLIKKEVGDGFLIFKKYGEYVRIHDLSNHHPVIGEFTI